ncbi:MAG: type II toxin-antitoxin system Phd/YefM family antitoxin [Planctomycetota bacterium]|nr:type II toxin-antitoxin system Phd/YefM family antitoxin [Planctomycetota bacterium]
MSPIDTVNARKNFSDTVNRAAYGKERVTLTRRGRPVAALVPVEDLALLEALEDKLDLDEARKALAAFKKSGKQASSLAAVKKKLGL